MYSDLFKLCFSNLSAEIKLHKKMKFPFTKEILSLVNVTESAGNCEFGRIYCKILNGKLHFLCNVNENLKLGEQRPSHY